jgi:hypothetical protein
MEFKVEEREKKNDYWCQTENVFSARIATS